MKLGLVVQQYIDLPERLELSERSPKYRKDQKIKYAVSTIYMLVCAHLLIVCIDCVVIVLDVNKSPTPLIELLIPPLLTS